MNRCARTAELQNGGILMKQLNIGIIGAGRIGKVHMKSITYSVPGAKVLGITDVFADALPALAAEYGIEKIYPD